MSVKRTISIVTKSPIVFFLPFYLLLSQYKFSGITLGTAGLFIICVSQMIRSRKIIIRKHYYPYIGFVAYAVLRDVLRIIAGIDPVQPQINRIIEYSVVFFLVIVVSQQPFNEDRLYNNWKRAGVLFSIGLIYHFVILYVFHRNIYPISIVPGYVMSSVNPEGSMRPCSFFAEPASFVSSMLPLEYMAMKRRDIKTAVWTTLVILLSTSTVGVILSMMVWLLEFMGRETSLKRKIIYIVVAAGVSVLFMYSEYFVSSFNKLIDIVNGGGTFASRIQNGFEIVNSLSIKSILFGTNYSDAQHYVADHLILFSSESVTMIRYRIDAIFLNTISKLIFMYGIPGLLLYFYSFLRTTKKKNVRKYVIIILISAFGQSTLLNADYFAMLMIVLLYLNESDQINLYKETGA